MVKKQDVSNETILQAVVSLGERVADLPTRVGIEKIVEDRVSETDKKISEVLREVKTLSRAVDKDAETVVKHSERITRIENHLSLT